MNWLAITTIAYFLVALEVILDKFLLTSRRVSHPSIYAFYSGTLSLFVLLLIPFGFHAIGFKEMLLSFAGGLFFVYGILSLFFAFNKNEASRVMTVVGAVIPIITLSLSSFFLKENLTIQNITGIFFLVVGGLYISIDKVKGRKLFSGFLLAVLAGISLASSYTIFKKIYDGDNFINVFVWTRFGVGLGAISLLAIKSWRRAIFNSLFKFKKPDAQSYSSGGIFVLVKILGGVGSILLHRAITLGSVTVVNALVSMEYLFIFLMGLLFSHFKPDIFQEKKDAKIIIQKIIAILIISVGIVLVSSYK